MYISSHHDPGSAGGGGHLYTCLQQPPNSAIPHHNTVLPYPQLTPRVAAKRPHLTTGPTTLRETFWAVVLIHSFGLGTGKTGGKDAKERQHCHSFVTLPGKVHIAVYTHTNQSGQMERWQASGYVW